jgi:hypothetical protein
MTPGNSVNVWNLKPGDLVYLCDDPYEVALVVGVKEKLFRGVYITTLITFLSSRTGIFIVNSNSNKDLMTRLALGTDDKT